MRLRSRSWSRSGALLAAVFGAAVMIWSADGQSRFAGEGSAFRTGATLVLVPVTVVDRHGSIVNGLASDAFTLTENGMTQQIRSFSQQDVPVSIGIVLDLSGSMQRALGTAKHSLRSLLENANPADEVFLNGVSTRPRAYSGFTQDLDNILAQVEFEHAGGSTALLDTVYASLNQLHGGMHARRALVVISDGMDNHSRYSRQQLLRYAVEADAQIYSIAVSLPSPAAKPIELTEEKNGILFLQELAAKTGGISFLVHVQPEVDEAAMQIGRALRSQYSIGYTPVAGNRDGKWRKISVKVAGPGLRACARTGYRFDSAVQ